MNLLCGAVGVICAFEGRLETAFYLMIAAAVFDFCDGLAARVLGAYSETGKELDSLSDMVSFGLLPSIMLHRLMGAAGNDSAWSYIPLVIAVFSALRLARFNTDDSEKDNFIGLATPACAMFCGALVHYICKTPDSFMAPWIGTRLFIPILSIVLSALMVSRIPMFSLKLTSFSWRANRALYVYLLLLLVGTILYGLPALTFAIPLYILVSLLAPRPQN